MSSADWFRNRTWDADVARSFEEKLARSRRKEQALRIQASTLARSHPGVAHSLLDRYFQLPNDFDHAQAHVDRAMAYLSEERVEEALGAYEAALRREAEFPKLLTNAYLDLPLLIASRRIEPRFERARELLMVHEKRLLFPVDRFKWHAAHALIEHASGNQTAAREHAAAALQNAEQGLSGIRSHPHVGLVTDSVDDLVQAMRRLRDV